MCGPARMMVCPVACSETGVMTFRRKRIPGEKGERRLLMATTTILSRASHTPSLKCVWYLPSEHPYTDLTPSLTSAQTFCCLSARDVSAKLSVPFDEPRFPLRRSSSRRRWLAWRPCGGSSCEPALRLASIRLATRLILGHVDDDVSDIWTCTETTSIATTTSWLAPAHLAQ